MRDELRLSLTDHLDELRRRLMICLSVVFVLFATVFAFFKEQVFHIFSAPIIKALDSAGAHAGTMSLHSKEPAEVLVSHLKISFMVALILSVPVILYQIWRFISPGLYGHERRATLPFVITATAAFALGALFCYTVVLPYGYAFLLTYAVNANVAPTIMVSEYVAGATRFLLIFGAIFEVPVVISFLARLGVVNTGHLVRFRTHAMVASFLVGALLTPPDAFTQVMLAFPLYLLFELSILGSRIMGRKRRDASQSDEDEADQESPPSAEEQPHKID